MRSMKLWKFNKGKGRKRFLACLLSLSVIPMNGFTVMAATNLNNQQMIVKTATSNSADTIGFEKDEDSINVGYFGKIPVRCNDDYDLELSSSDTNTLDIHKKYSYDKDDNLIIEYYYDPHKAGPVELSAEYVAKDGESYKYTMKVNVGDVEKGIVPILSYDMYDNVCDNDDNQLDENGDHRLSYEEFAKAYDISWANCDLTDADLDILKYAPSCEDLNLEENIKVTDINKVLGYMKKLKRINIENTSVTDFSGLNNIKNQLERLWLPDSASMETRFGFIKDRTYIKAGDSMYANHLNIKNVLVGYDYIFTSADPSVIEIQKDEEGDMQIVAKEGQEGKAAYVTIESGNLKKTVQMVVTDKNGNVAIQGIKINKSSITLNPGQEEQLSVSYDPDYATNCSATWTSSNGAVVSVDVNGKVTAKSTGTAVITATTPNGKTAQCMITVENPTPQLVKVSKISIKGISTKIAAGKKLKLTANIIPSNASNKSVTWITNNKKVATVNANGVVSVNKKAGGKTVTITATAKDGSGTKATYKIKVMKAAVKKIKISGKKSVKAGKTLSLKTKVTASKGANKKLIWTSSNTKYATVSASGKVKALKAGKKKSVKITAMATDGSGKKATVTIKIK